MQVFFEAAETGILGISCAFCVTVLWYISADLVLLHLELGILPAMIMLGLAVIPGFYFQHFFFLENTVQRWYRIAGEMREK